MVYCLDAKAAHEEAECVHFDFFLLPFPSSFFVCFFLFFSLVLACSCSYPRADFYFLVAEVNFRICERMVFVLFRFGFVQMSCVLFLFLNEMDL